MCVRERYLFHNNCQLCEVVYRYAKAMAPSKPTCPIGYRLLETVTQTSTNGATNEWYAAHVVYNDTTNAALYSAGLLNLLNLLHLMHLMNLLNLLNLIFPHCSLKALLVW